MFRNKSFIVFLIIFLQVTLSFSNDIIQNVYNRESFTLNGKWRYIVDPYETGYYDYRYQPYDQSDNPAQSGGFFVNQKAKLKTDRVEYNFDQSDVINVPGDWNYQKEKLYYYEGTVWYKKSFNYEKKDKNNRLFIYFGAANYKAEVYLNAQKLGTHKGGFTPFNFEITDIVKEKDNFVVVKVDNKRKKEEVPTVNTDWWNFGGLTRDVKIIEVPATFIQDYKVQLGKRSTREIKGFVQLDGKDISKEKITLSIPELQIEKTFRTDKKGRAEITLSVKDLTHWSFDNPKLYKVNLLTDEDNICDQIGFRTIETKGREILLNNEPVFLKGICIHEENPIRGGRAYGIEDARMLLGWAKELGCNFVRLAHYPHNENMVRLADEMGIMVWEENPVYWTIEFDNPYTLNAAKQQLREVMSRDKNRASVIIWSMANETPVGDPRMKFLKELRSFALNIDNTRLISAALELHGKHDDVDVKMIVDPFAEYVDVLAFNQYVGWYDGLPEKCSRVKWAIEQDKPVVISEFGGGALQGYHGDKNTRWTEEFQEHLYEESLEMLQRIPQLRGTCPWILADFHSPKRVLPVIQGDWNRKGLISETGDRKKAFYVMKKFYKEISVEKVQESK
ncbi:MAG: glycoside hydrolase family 2 protein [Fidelibacterota bacterium]